MRNNEPVCRIASQPAPDMNLVHFYSACREGDADGRIPNQDLPHKIRPFLTSAASRLFIGVCAAAAARCDAFCSARFLLLLLLLPTREACYDSRTYQPCYAALTSQLNPTVTNAASLDCKIRCLKSKTCDNMMFFSNWIRTGKLKYQ